MVSSNTLKVEWNPPPPGREQKDSPRVINSHNNITFLTLQGDSIMDKMAGPNCNMSLIWFHEKYSSVYKVTIKTEP